MSDTTRSPRAVFIMGQLFSSSSKNLETLGHSVNNRFYWRFLQGIAYEIEMLYFNRNQLKINQIFVKTGKEFRPAFPLKVLAKCLHE